MKNTNVSPYSLKKRITLSILLLILTPLLLIGGYGYYTYTTHLTDITIRYTEQILTPLQQQIEQTFKKYEASLVPIWLHEDLQTLIHKPSNEWVHTPRDVINVRKHMRETFGWQQDVEGLFVITEDKGLIYEVVSSPVNMNYAFETQDFYVKSQHTNEAFVSGPNNQTYVRGKDVFSITRSLRSSPAFEWKGVMHLDINADSIYSFFQMIEIGKDGYIVAIDSEGRSIYQTNTYSEQALDESIYDEVMLNLKKGKEGSLYTKINGKQHLITFEYSDYLDWLFIGVVPLKEITKVANDIRNTVLVISVTTLLFIIIISWKLNEMILSPLNDINQAIKGLGYGNFSMKLRSTNILELRPIINQYNLTVERLKYLTEKLYHANIRQKESEIKSQRLLILKQESELRQREAELGQLEAQINPHFLYNTLSCIQSLAELNETDKIDRSIGLLSGILRYSLAFDLSQIKIVEELKHTEAFVEIQKLRHEDMISVVWDVDEHTLNHCMNRLTIQPLVENAYFHGVEPKLGKGEIQIILKKRENQIYLQVKDNGVGMSEKKLNEFNEFINRQKQYLKQYTSLEIESTQRLSGLLNVIRRLFLVHGENVEIEIQSQLNIGTQITIIIEI